MHTCVDDDLESTVADHRTVRFFKVNALDHARSVEYDSDLGDKFVSVDDVDFEFASGFRSGVVLLNRHLALFWLIFSKVRCTRCLRELL